MPRQLHKILRIGLNSEYSKALLSVKDQKDNQIFLRERPLFIFSPLCNKCTTSIFLGGKYGKKLRLEFGICTIG